MKRLWIAFVLLPCLAGPSLAEFEAGRDAYIRGDFTLAYQEFLSPANEGDSKSRIGLGLLAIAAAYYARAIFPTLAPVWKVTIAYGAAVALFAVGKVFEAKLARFAKPVMAANSCSFGSIGNARARWEEVTRTRHGTAGSGAQRAHSGFAKRPTCRTRVRSTCSLR